MDCKRIYLKVPRCRLSVMKSILSLSLILAGNVANFFRIAMPGSISLVHQLLDQDCVVAETFGIDHDAVAEAFIRIGASILILVRAHPVWSALVAALSPPTRLADAEVLCSVAWSMAESVIAIEVTRWLVTQVSFPARFTDAGVRMIDASSM